MPTTSSTISNLESLPCVDGQPAARPAHRQTAALRGAVTSVQWWSWLGQKAHQAFHNESGSFSSHRWSTHGWSTVERVLTSALDAWEDVDSHPRNQVRVNENPEQSDGVWSRPAERWQGTSDQRRQAARVLRALRGFYGPLHAPFDPIGRNPVHQHAQERCLTLALRLLVRAFPGWDDAWFAQNGVNAHPAFVAVQRNQAAVLTAWLDHGLTPNLRSDGRTLLQEAACQGHEDLVELLLQHGARPNERRRGERSALQHALALPTPNVFDRLRAHGARWPTCGWWVNPETANPAHGHAERWVARPMVMDVALWSHSWAWHRWAQDHPSAFAALDMTVLEKRMSSLWSLEMTWAGNPGVGPGTLAFRLPPAEKNRLPEARRRQAVVMQEQALRQTVQTLEVPCAPRRAPGPRL